MLGCATSMAVGTCWNNSDLKVAANHTEKWTITLPFICSVPFEQLRSDPGRFQCVQSLSISDVSYHQVLYSFPLGSQVDNLAYIGMAYSVGTHFSIRLSRLFTSHKIEPCISAMPQHFQIFSDVCGFFFLHLFKKSETLKANNFQIVSSSKNQSQSQSQIFTKFFEVPQFKTFPYNPDSSKYRLDGEVLRVEKLHLHNT